MDKIFLLPDKGAQFGQFGALNASPEKTWVMDAESMLGDAKKPFDISRTIQRGAKQRATEAASSRRRNGSRRTAGSC